MQRFVVPQPVSAAYGCAGRGVRFKGIFLFVRGGMASPLFGILGEGSLDPGLQGFLGCE